LSKWRSWKQREFWGFSRRKLCRRKAEGKKTKEQKKKCQIQRKIHYRLKSVWRVMFHSILPRSFSLSHLFYIPTQFIVMQFLLRCKNNGIFLWWLQKDWFVCVFAVSASEYVSDIVRSVVWVVGVESPSTKYILDFLFRSYSLVFWKGIKKLRAKRDLSFGNTFKERECLQFLDKVILWNERKVKEEDLDVYI